MRLKRYTKGGMKATISEKVARFFSKFKTVSIPHKKTFLSPSLGPNGIYYLKKGFVRQYSISNEGLELTIHLFAPGAFFPMIWALNDIENRYYYETITDSEFNFSDKEAVIAFLEKDHDVLMDLTKRVLRGLDRLSTRIEQMANSRAKIRLASIIVFIARHFGTSENDRMIIPKYFTHHDMAMWAGLTRETTSREWEKFKKDRLVEIKNKQIVIPSFKNLLKIIE